MKLRDKSKLRHLIEFNHIEVRELAKQAGLSESGLWHLLRDPSFKTSRSTCDSETARRIERALQVDPGSLFEPELLTVASNAQLEELKSWLLEERRPVGRPRVKAGARR